jgi:signal transduction histidine kinase
MVEGHTPLEPARPSAGPFSFPGFVPVCNPQLVRAARHIALRCPRRKLVLHEKRTSMPVDPPNRIDSPMPRNDKIPSSDGYTRRMRLSTFILRNLELILQEWEDFARSLGTVSSSMDVAALRDHAELILRVVATDLETPQSAAQQDAKSKGNAPSRSPLLPPTAATTHGATRAEEGFSLAQMVSEYRALRASVLRLWADSHAASADATPVSDLYDQQIRFNEAVDEALADSIKTYSYALDQMVVTKARHRMEALGTLAAGLGHDMANVLMPMRSCLQTLTEEGLTSTTAPLLDALRRAVDHLSGLGKGLRALSLDPDDTAPFETTELREWWTTAVSPFTWALPKGVRLHCEGFGKESPDLPPVRLPAHALMQAVFNLVQNAAQALGMRNTAAPETEPTGNIWISARLSSPAEASALGAHESAVSLTVRDDGPGMDATTASRCTEAFFTTKPRDHGTGLGLFLVRTLMERHGGKLLIASKVGDGTSFTLVLPPAVPPVTVTTAIRSGSSGTPSGNPQRTS